MPSGRFSKQAVWFSTKLNNNYSDSVIGGAINTGPSGLNASQGQQTLPGDRIILNPADALYWSNNTVGNLYTGTYRYVASRNNSTSAPARGHAAFWDASANGTGNNISAEPGDALYQVTSDEAANVTVCLFAGVYINNMAAGNYWWIQESGKASCKYRVTLTGAAVIGEGVYLAAAGNNNNAADIGSLDALQGANGGTTFSAANTSTAYNAIDNMFVRYVGPAETLPVANNIALVDIVLSRASFRW